MNFLIKGVKFVYGLGLLLFCTRKLDINKLFKDKRIAIIGPANSAYNTGAGAYIDSFDYVIRLNKAPRLVREGQFMNDIGKKTDVLFHSFMENEFSGGGPLDFALFDEVGIRYVVNPIPTYIGWRVTLNFYKKYLSSRTVFRLSYKPYKRIQNRIGGYRPTTGLSALFRALESDFSELFITGFTFFKTPYADGYRDAIKESEKAVQYLKSMKIHDPDKEFREFKRLLEENKGKKIVLDDTLQKIIEAN
jgi:hypothetical protein